MLRSQLLPSLSLISLPLVMIPSPPLQVIQLSTSQVRLLPLVPLVFHSPQVPTPLRCPYVYGLVLVRLGLLLRTCQHCMRCSNKAIAAFRTAITFTTATNTDTTIEVESAWV